MPFIDEYTEYVAIFFCLDSLSYRLFAYRYFAAITYHKALLRYCCRFHTMLLFFFSRAAFDYAMLRHFRFSG